MTRGNAYYVMLIFFKNTKFAKCVIRKDKVLLVFKLKTEMFLPSSCRIHRVDKEGYLIQTIHKDGILQFPEVWKSWI